VNYIRAEVKKIQSVDALNIVEFSASGQKIKMMSLELNEDIKVGAKVRLSVKSTNISLAKELNSKISISNILHVEIKEIKYGELLCSVRLKFALEELECVITKEACLDMDLQNEKKIMALISENEVSIMEVL
jgi:molybdopterin-binding protein